MLVFCLVFFFFFKQKTAYEMRISDWSSDVCSSDLRSPPSSGASRHLLPQAGEGLAIGLPRAGEGCSGGSARPSWFEEKASGRSHPYTITKPTLEGSRFPPPPSHSANHERMCHPTLPLDRPASPPAPTGDFPARV